MSSNFMNSVTSPLPRKYCDYFYYLTIVAFIALVFIFAGAFKTLIVTSGSSSMGKILTGVVGLLVVCLPMFIGYFQTRLFYTMCKASVK